MKGKTHLQKRRDRTPVGTVRSRRVAEEFGVTDTHIHTLMSEGHIPELLTTKRARPIPAKWFEGIINTLAGSGDTLPITGHKFRDLVIANRWRWEFSDPTSLASFVWNSAGPSFQNGTTEQPAQFELPTEEGPRKISKAEIPAFRCSYQEFFDCTAEGSEYDVNLDIALREGRSPWAGMVTVKCKNMCATEVNGEIVDWWCNREGLAEPFEKLHNLKDPRREEIQRLRDEASAKAAKADDLERNLGNG